MPAPMVVEFPNGNKIILGRGAAVTGLSEVSLVGDVAKPPPTASSPRWGHLANLLR